MKLPYEEFHPKKVAEEIISRGSAQGELTWLVSPLDIAYELVSYEKEHNNPDGLSDRQKAMSGLLVLLIQRKLMNVYEHGNGGWHYRSWLVMQDLIQYAQMNPREED